MHPYPLWKKWLRLQNPNPWNRFYFRVTEQVERVAQFTNEYRWDDDLMIHVYWQRVNPDDIWNGSFYRRNYIWETRLNTGKGNGFILSFFGWIISILRRWRAWAKARRMKRERRAANTIRNFYFNYIQPRVYNPHTGGRGFLKLLARLQQINED